MSTKFCLSGQHEIFSRERFLTWPTEHPCNNKWALFHLLSFEGLSIKHEMFLSKSNISYVDLTLSDHILEGLASLYSDARWIHWILLSFCIQPISFIPKQQLVSALQHQVQPSYHTKGAHFYSKHIQNWLDSTVLLLIKTLVTDISFPFSSSSWKGFGAGITSSIAWGVTKQTIGFLPRKRES